MNYDKIFAHDDTVEGINRAIKRGAKVAAAYINDARKNPCNYDRTRSIWLQLTAKALMLMYKHAELVRRQIRNN